MMDTTEKDNLKLSVLIIVGATFFILIEPLGWHGWVLYSLGLVGLGFA